MGVFPHLWPAKIIFQKLGSVIFIHLWCSNFMQNTRDKQWTVSEIFTDTNHGQERWLRTPSGEPGVQYVEEKLSKIAVISLKTSKIVNLQSTINVMVTWETLMPNIIKQMFAITYVKINNYRFRRYLLITSSNEQPVL